MTSKSMKLNNHDTLNHLCWSVQVQASLQWYRFPQQSCSTSLLRSSSCSQTIIQCSHGAAEIKPQLSPPAISHKVTSWLQIIYTSPKMN